MQWITSCKLVRLRRHFQIYLSPGYRGKSNGLGHTGLVTIEKDMEKIAKIENGVGKQEREFSVPSQPMQPLMF